MHPFSKIYQRSGRVTCDPLTVHQGKFAVWTVDTIRNQVWNDIQQYGYPIETVTWDFWKCTIQTAGKALVMEFFPTSIVWHLGGQESYLCVLPDDGLRALDSLQDYSLARQDFEDALSVRGPLGAVGLLSILPPTMLNCSVEQVLQAGYDIKPSKLYKDYLFNSTALVKQSR